MKDYISIALVVYVVFFWLTGVLWKDTLFGRPEWAKWIILIGGLTLVPIWVTLVGLPMLRG